MSLVAAAMAWLRRYRFRHRYRDVDVVYSNTITNGALMDRLQALGVPVLTHVHELPQILRRLPTSDLQAVISGSAMFLVASKPVEQMLIEKFDVPARMVTVVPGCIDWVPDAASHMGCGVEPNGRRVIAAAGLIEWRKGPDLFVLLARELVIKRQRNDLEFRWYGVTDTTEREAADLDDDVRRCGLHGVVSFLPVSEEMVEILKCVDVFVLTSREDPYPLVVLEAGSLGVPTVCFADSGGTPAFVGAGCGTVVPYLDVAAMADALIELVDNDDRRKQLGARAIAMVKAENTAVVVAGRVGDAIDELIAHPGVVGTNWRTSHHQRGVASDV